MWAIGVAAAAAVYATSSYVLLKHPQLLHKRKRIAFNCYHISHRGGAGETLENTIAAFRHAVDCGTEMLELDCQLTADKEVVVAHDDHLLRVTGIDAHISETAFKDLPLLKPSLALDFDRDFFCPPSEDRKIPLLREVFQEFPNVPINIDIKQEDERLMEEVSKLVRSFQRGHLTVWGNFRDSVCQKCYKKDPNIHLLFSQRRVLLLCLWFYTGLLPFIPLKEDFLEIVMPSVILDNPHAMIRPTGRQRFLIRLIDKLLMNKSLFDHLRRRGMQTYLWVLNRDQEFERAFSLGVDGVMTDFPTRLRQFLDDNPEFCRK